MRVLTCLNFSRPDAAFPPRRRIVRWVAVFAVALVTAGAGGAAASQNPDDKSETELSRRSVPLDDAERKQLLRWVLTRPSVTRLAPGHRFAGIRVTLAAVVAATGQTQMIATAVLFDHTDGEAHRVDVDADSGDLLTHERLPGRPQRSPEEFEDAVRIVRRDDVLGRLLDDGAVLDGGFIVDDPAGSRHRMIQLKLLSADRFTLLRSITVDLTDRVIASATGVGP
jgi:hypothetical protein